MISLNIKKRVGNATRFLTLQLPVFALAALAVSCSDWDDHYDGQSAAGGNLTSWEMLQSNPNLSNFCKVLQETKVFRHHKKTDVSYADMLNGGQSFTVFAPSNEKFTEEIMQQYLEQLATNQGDSVVEKKFILNHLSRTTAANRADMQSILLANGKHIEIGQDKVGTVNILSANNRTNNGVLHITDDIIPYGFNIYEALCETPAISAVGTQINKYSEDYFDPDNSVSNGMIDGVIQYVDSVIIERNTMLNEVGLLASEDSVYAVVVPENASWQKAFEEAKTYYVYGSNIENGDSLQSRWATRALLDDAIFSYTIQDSPKDSLISQWYNRRRPEGHVFYKPFQPGGIMGNPTAVINCSNGTLYQTAEWPFTPQETYFKRIRVEAENKANLINYDVKTNKFNAIERTHYADSVSESGYLYIKPNPTTENWNATFRINNTLAGEYDVKLVLLPKTVYDPSSAETNATRPVRFNAEISYRGADGKEVTIACTNGSKKYFEEEPTFTDAAGVGHVTKVDTITIATVKFPVCNYDLGQNDNVKVKLTCNISNNSTTQTKKFSREMFLDCIVLEPKKKD